uniref:FAM86 N-terminal domain-containing protein n=1 Tax=Timema poppense TaxID=170557 RepID=A0A7R9H422_TIMPO|nr:unnamed protein product [Timema poppensis]
MFKDLPAFRDLQCDFQLGHKELCTLISEQTDSDYVDVLSDVSCELSVSTKEAMGLHCNYGNVIGISKLENAGVEVCDDLYSAYCSLLSCRPEEDGTHYKHYLLSNYEADLITLKESCSLVSQGTTGLCSWQAAQALAEWCVTHRLMLAHKEILELGSGAGLTGLTVSLCCRPRSFHFSDCHPAVLQLLCHNVALNTKHPAKTKLSEAEDCHTQTRPTGNQNLDDIVDERVKYRTNFNGTLLQVLYLPWEDIPHNIVGVNLSPDFVLASDVVYDASIFDPLCNAFCHFIFQGKHGCTVVLACTVRNKDTLEQFLSLLDSRGLQVKEEEFEPTKMFLYEADTPITIYLITAPL